VRKGRGQTPHMGEDLEGDARRIAQCGEVTMNDENPLFAAIGREPAPGKGKAEHPLIDRSRWGLFPDIDIEAYHLGKLPGLKPEDVTLSQGAMRRLLEETPLDFAFNHPQLNPDALQKVLETVAARRGDVVHQLALGKGRGFAIGDYADWRTKEAKAFRDAAVAAGKVPIKLKDFEEAEVMADVVKERIEEAVDGSPYETEVAFLYQEMTPSGPVWVRGLMDVWCEEKLLILDPKITGQLYDSTIGRHVLNMGWDRQAALYPHAVGQILGDQAAGRVRFRELMVKPEAPYTSRVVKLDKAWHWSALKQCERAMHVFAECLYAGRWPGFEEEATIELPVWEAKKREAAELAGIA